MTATSSNLKDIGRRQDTHSFSYFGDNQKTVQRVNDVTNTTKVVSISAETVTISAGAAGTTGVVQLGYAPVYDSTGSFVGSYQNTSFAFITGTVLDAEVDFNEKLSDTNFLATLSQGEYSINYDAGKLYYCKATTDTSDTANYKVRNTVMNYEADIEIGAVEGKDATTDTRWAIKTDNATLGATPNSLLVGGIYKASLDTYDDNDSSPFHMDVNGRLLTDAKVTLNDYTDDSNEFTVGSSMLLAVGGIATSDSVDANDVGAFRMTIARNLGIDVTTKDGAAWAVGNAINTTIGDGTTVPVVETTGAKKALNVNITDGTNDMPTGDALARSLFVNVGDGTTTAVVETTGTKKALNVNITDGTNDMPTMDANTRLGYVTLSDGTIDLSFGTDVMANSLPTTFATDDTQLGAVGADADVDGNVHGQLRYIGEAVDGLEETVPLPEVDYKSPANFTATYTSTTTITLSSLSGFSITDSSQIAYVVYTPTGGTGAKRLVNGLNGVTLTISSNVITVDGAGTPFAAGDVYKVGINALPFELDPSTQSMKISNLNPAYNQNLPQKLEDAVDIAAGTHYYPSESGGTMDGYKHYNANGNYIDPDGTITVTFEVTNDDDTTPGNRVWSSIYWYDAILDSNVNTYTATNGTITFDMSIDFLNKRYYRHKVVNNGATNTFVNYERKLY